MLTHHKALKRPGHASPHRIGAAPPRLQRLADGSAGVAALMALQRRADHRASSLHPIQMKKISEEGYSATNSNAYFTTNHVGTMEDAASKSAARGNSVKHIDTNTVLLISEADAKALVAAADYTMIVSTAETSTA